MMHTRKRLSFLILAGALLFTAIPAVAQAPSSKPIPPHPTAAGQRALLAEADPYEPNETPEQAYGPLDSDRVYEAYIWTETDENDYYHFTPASDNRAAGASLADVPPGCDYDLYVYAADTADGRAKLIAYSNRFGDADERVTFAAAAGVKYYVRVYQYEGFSERQPYHLVADYDPLYRLYLPLLLNGYPPRPTGSVAVAGRTANAHRQAVTLALSATVAGDTVTHMRLRNADTDWGEGDWEPFTTTRAWSLADGDSGLRTVYAQFRGSAGGVSAPVSTQIYLSRNGDFEDGAAQTAWQVAANPLPVAIVQGVQEQAGDPTPPAGGDYALLLGSPDYPCSATGVPLGYAAAEQTFSLPPNAGALTFKYIVWSQDASTSGEYDRFEVYVDGDLAFHDGNQVNDLSCSKWWRVPSAENPRWGQTSGWATGTLDLGAYAGQTATVSFRVYNRFDHWYTTYAYVDDVVVLMAR